MFFAVKKQNKPRKNVQLREDKTNPNYVQFQWNSAGLTFENWQVAHFRVLGQDKYNPYGTSVLEPARRIWRQLTLLEDAMMAYRIVRSPERRAFYIDVGNLPKAKAEQYLREVMSRYRNKLTYDASTGEIRDDKKYMSMMEDFWLPRREGGRGTEISTLPGGQNLGELTDVEYFQKKLFRSLNVPESRMADNSGFSLGRSSEILRDELKFTKFVGRMRKRFSGLFHDILKTQLILKNVCTPEEWERMSDHIQYDFLYDNHFAELKDAELMQERLGLVATADPYIGKYYSVDYIRRKILRQTDDEVNEQDKLIAAEKEAGLIPPTEQEMQIAQMAIDAENKGQKSEIEPEIDTSTVEEVISDCVKIIYKANTYCHCISYINGFWKFF